MKALVLDEVGKIACKEVPQPRINDDEVLVRVRACGICGSDIPRAYKNGAHKMPLIIGHEFAGELAESGKRVGVFPLIPCRDCGPCMKRKYEMCRNYSYLGSRKDGGFAEYVAVPKKNIIEIPNSVSNEAAAMIEPMAVAVHALKQAGLITRYRILSDEELIRRQNLHVVICGAGTIGLFVVMFLFDAGYENISVIGNRDIQRQMASRLGVFDHRFYDVRIPEQKEAAEKLEADVFFECVGKQETYEQAINQTAPGGTVCLVGNPYSDMNLSQNTYWKILRNQITINGTWNSSFTGELDDDWHYVVNRLALGAIEPERLITHRFSLDEATKGFELMRDKTEDYIKVMVDVD